MVLGRISAKNSIILGYYPRGHSGEKCHIGQSIIASVEEEGTN